MDQQKPRDNSMYNISDRTNLKKHDKALQSYTSKYGVFGNKMLTQSEINNSTKTFHGMSKMNFYATARTTAASRGSTLGKTGRFTTTDKESATSEIWQSFTVPVKFRIPSRSGRKRGRRTTVRGGSLATIDRSDNPADYETREV